MDPTQSGRAGVWLALTSAALFGVSPALVKITVGELQPVFLAGLLYLGSALGLLLVLLAKKSAPLAELGELPRKHWFKLLGAVLSGGILAPVCLVYGIRGATAFEASVLLNLETVATTLIAWLVFHEHVGARVWTGKALLILGALIISVTPGMGVSFGSASLPLIGACVFWGIDNNLTRDLETLSPAVLASFKGLSAGIFNCSLAYALGQSQGNGTALIGSLIIGAFSYGVSLILFIEALRKMGSSRTSTYFATGPFLGMVFAVILLGERPELQQWISAFFMLAGVGILYYEHHEHPHTHEPLTHSHRHTHDEHHQHRHEHNEGPEPHEHAHTHEVVTHTHAHLPDIHHRHIH